MEDFGRHMMAQHIKPGATVSLVPFLRGTWQQLHYGDPKWQYIPDAPGSVRTMIFQLQTNGPPGFLRPFMTDNGRDANIQFFYPDHKGDTIEKAVEHAQEFVDANPIGEVIIRLDKNKAPKGAPFYNPQKLLDTWYYMIGPMLPTAGAHADGPGEDATRSAPTGRRSTSHFRSTAAHRRGSRTSARRPSPTTTRRRPT